MHDSTLGGHLGITGTFQRLKMLFHWPNMKNEVQVWVRECETCQRAKHENTTYPGLLQPLPIPEQACISMDFVEGLPHPMGQGFHKQFLERAIWFDWGSLDMSSAYHPQKDGQTERINQCLENYLRCLVWEPTNQLTIGPYLHCHHSDVEELMQGRIKLMQLLKENLQQAQHRMKNYADKKRTEREFQ
ncbi:UNVERIFIED_CONTAM: hypothetical protein Slati_1846300, partial [Sesamum latifolium]